MVTKGSSVAKFGVLLVSTAIFMLTVGEIILSNSHKESHAPAQVVGNLIHPLKPQEPKDRVTVAQKETENPVVAVARAQNWAVTEDSLHHNAESADKPNSSPSSAQQHPLTLEYNTSKFPWLPDVFNGAEKGKIARDPRFATSDKDDIEWEVVSFDTPRVIRTKNILNATECQSIIDVALPWIKRNTVGSGKPMLSNVRTSEGMFMVSAKDRDIFANQKLRNAAQVLTGLGDQNWIEATQVLRYSPGQFYRPHLDVFSGSSAALRGGERFASMLTVLHMPEGEGGETEFPHAQPVFPGAPRNSTSKALPPVQRITVKPEVGGSVLFYNVDRNGVIDTHATHGGVEPLNGTKWVAVTWLHPRTFH